MKYIPSVTPVVRESSIHRSAASRFQAVFVMQSTRIRASAFVAIIVNVDFRYMFLPLVLLKVAVERQKMITQIAVRKETMSIAALNLAR